MFIVLREIHEKTAKNVEIIVSIKGIDIIIQKY